MICAVVILLPALKIKADPARKHQASSNLINIMTRHYIFIIHSSTWLISNYFLNANTSNNFALHLDWSLVTIQYANNLFLRQSVICNVKVDHNKRFKMINSSQWKAYWRSGAVDEGLYLPPPPPAKVSLLPYKAERGVWSVESDAFLNASKFTVAVEGSVA